MRKDSEIFLIGTSGATQTNALGNAIPVPIKRHTFAEKKSVRQSEFYQAAVSDLKPQFTFVVWTLEYHGESELEYEGKKYKIIRTFEPDEKDTELVCEGLSTSG